MKNTLIILVLLVFGFHTKLSSQGGSQSNNQTDWVSAWSHYIPETNDNLFDILSQSSTQFNANTNLNYAQKRFERNNAYLEGRLSTDPMALGNMNDYRTALTSYLGAYTCQETDLADWQFIGPKPSQFDDKHQMGQVSSAFLFADNPDEILLGSATSGIWRTANGGENWVNVSQALGYPTLGVTQIKQSSFNPDVIYASSGISHGFLDLIGIGLLRSDDRGMTWSQVDLPTTGGAYPRINDVSFNPTDNTIFAISNNEIFWSTDFGFSWTIYPVPGDKFLHNYFYEIEVMESTGRIFLTAQPRYGDTHQIWTADSYGAWINITETFDYGDGTTGQSIKLSKTFGQHFAIGYSNSVSDRAVVVSHDYGASFGLPTVNYGAGSGLISKFEVEVSQQNTSQFYYGGLYMERGTEGVGYEPLMPGISISSSFHVDVRFVQVIENPDTGEDIVLVGNDGGLSISNDAGENWESINGDLDNTQAFGIGFATEEDPDILMGLMDNYTIKLSDGEITNVLGGDGEEIGTFHNGSSLYFQPYGSTVYTNDASFFPALSSFNALIYPNEFYLGSPLKVDNVNKRAFVGLDNAGAVNAAKLVIYKDSGASRYEFPEGTSKVQTIGFCDADPDILFAAIGNAAATSHHLYKSTDGGASFDAVGGMVTTSTGDLVPFSSVLAWKAIRNIQISPTDPNKVWVCLDGVFSSGGTPQHETFRVLYSDDGGSSWIDYSEGLSALPAMTMIYYQGSEDLLFLGTDAGVFYRDRTMGQWQCFQQGLPYVPVVDMEINYCTNELVIATFGRGVYQSPIPFENSFGELVINEDQTWDTDVYMPVNIKVTAGNTLTITGTLYMSEYKKIMVEQGAKLEVTDGTITSSCGKLWKGIEAWGNSDEPQTYSDQGWVILHNATIEHAHVAIDAWRPSFWLQTGGVIMAYNSTFRNNRRAVSFTNYVHTVGDDIEVANKSIFRNVDFIWDDDFRALPLNHASLYKVTGVRFAGCHFSDDRTGANFTRPYLTDGSITKCGIRSIDAKYFVNAACNSMDLSECGEDFESEPWNPSTFNNLDFGIYAADSYTIYPIDVKRSVFTNNLYGIFTDALHTPKIILNRFYYTNVNNSYIPYTKYGIQLMKTQNIIVEENDFQNTFGAGIGICRGILCSDLGENNEMVRKNNFHGLAIANLTEGKNRGPLGSGYPAGSTGLSFECNTNQQNTTDFEVQGTGEPNGIKANIGDFVQAAGNTFSPTATDHFINEPSHPLNYFWAAGQEPTMIDPADVTTIFTTYTPQCASNFPLEGSGNVHWGNRFHQLKYELSPLIAEYEDYLSQGTQPPLQLENEIIYLSGQKSQAAHLMLASLYQEEEPNLDLNAVEQWVQLDNDFLVSMQLTDLYIQKLDFGKAQTELSTLTSSISSTTSQAIQQEINDFVSLKHIIMAALAQQNTVANISEAQKNQIRSIAINGSGIAKNQARELLCFFFEECTPALPNQAISALNLNAPTPESIHTNFKGLFPNPTTGLVHLFLENIETTYQINVYNVRGQLVQSLETTEVNTEIDLGNLANGIYFIQASDGVDSFTQQIVKM